MKNISLREMRKLEGTTLSEVSEAIQLHPANLSRIERGLQTPSTELAERLSQYYDGKINEMQILYPERYENSA